MCVSQRFPLDDIDPSDCPVGRREFEARLQSLERQITGRPRFLSGLSPWPILIFGFMVGLNIGKALL